MAKLGTTRHHKIPCLEITLPMPSWLLWAQGIKALTVSILTNYGIYTLLLQPAQEILLKMQGTSSPKDDEHDVKVAVSGAMYDAHQKLHIYWQVARTTDPTDSPQQGFPFNGHSLVEPDGPYFQRLAEIRGHIRSGDNSLFAVGYVRIEGFVWHVYTQCNIFNQEGRASAAA